MVLAAARTFAPHYPADGVCAAGVAHMPRRHSFELNYAIRDVTQPTGACTAEVLSSCASVTIVADVAQFDRNPTAFCEVF